MPALKYYLSSTCEAELCIVVIMKELRLKYLGLTLDHQVNWEKHINILDTKRKFFVKICTFEDISFRRSVEHVVLLFDDSRLLFVGAFRIDII